MAQKMQEARLLLHSRSQTMLPTACLTVVNRFSFSTSYIVDLIVHIFNSNFTIFDYESFLYLVGNTGSQHHQPLWNGKMMVI